MIKTVLKFILTIIVLIVMLLILTFRFTVSGKRNEDVYEAFIDDYFKFWGINLKVVEKK